MGQLWVFGRARDLFAAVTMEQMASGDIPTRFGGNSRDAQCPKGRAPHLAVKCVVTTLGALVCSCGTSPAPSATTLLAQARAHLVAAGTAHVVISSSHIPTSGTQAVSGAGDAAASPDRFFGTIVVTEEGLPITVTLAARGSTVEAKAPPIFPTYHTINPGQYGFVNPSHLLDTADGLPALLAQPHSPKDEGSHVVNGVVVYTVVERDPASMLSALVPIAGSSPVTVTYSITQGSDTLVSVTLSGDLVTANTISSYTMALSNYGEHVGTSLPH